MKQSVIKFFPIDERMWITLQHDSPSNRDMLTFYGDGWLVIKLPIEHLLMLYSSKVQNGQGSQTTID